MRRSTLLLILYLSVPAPTWAFTEAEIDQAALVARQIDIVSQIAGDVYQGRDNDTPGSTAVQSLLVQELKQVADGLDSGQTGDDAYKQTFSTSATGTNLLAVIPGSDLASEYVMLGAHYDHLGQFGSAIFNGAQDNAAGVAIVLAIGAAIDSLPTPPRRSIILALWDAEEDGLAGSLAYLASPIVPLSSIVAYINFDIQGANLLPSIRNTSFSIGAESGGSALESLVQDAVAAEASVDTRPLTRLFGQERSDHANFMDTVPSVFFSDATGSCYHTPDDDVAVVDLEKLREQSQIAFRLALALAETTSPPSLATSGVVVYGDAVEMAGILNQAVAEDLGLFAPAEQATLLAQQALVQGLVDDGPAQFGGFDPIDLLLAAEATLDSLLTLPCDGFLAATPPGPRVPALSPGGAGLLVALVIGMASWRLGRR